MPKRKSMKKYKFNPDPLDEMTKNKKEIKKEKDTKQGERN